MELKRLWKEYKEAERVWDEIDAVLEATDVEDPDFERVDREWDEANEAYGKALAKVMDEIRNLIGCDERTARLMVYKKGELIESLMNRVA
jgi:deoxyribose-phosphate aldolase